MEKLFLHSQILAKEVQEIPKELFKYSNDKNDSKIPLPVIAHSIATLMRDLSILWADVNEKIRNDT